MNSKSRRVPNVTLVGHVTTELERIIVNEWEAEIWEFSGRLREIKTQAPMCRRSLQDSVILCAFQKKLRKFHTLIYYLLLFINLTEIYVIPW